MLEAMRILFIRHGQTPANVAGILATDHPGPGLTELGEQQAAALPNALAPERVHGIYVSTLVRTHATAAPLAAARRLDPVIEDGLHEIEAGELEGRRDREAVMQYFGTLNQWGLGNLGAAMPGAGDGFAFFDRYNRSLDRIIERHPEPDATVAVVSHGAAIRVWCGGSAINVDPDFAVRNDLENTGVVVVEGSRRDGFVVESWMNRPIGGRRLADPAAADPTGESFDLAEG
tara:strand:+ start:35265 stop:35957 length:693 start_codon:yes stop_codon:yes gene_type:complete